MYGKFPWLRVPTTSLSRLTISRPRSGTRKHAVVTVAAVTAAAWIPRSGIRIWLRIDQHIGLFAPVEIRHSEGTRLYLDDRGSLPL